MLVIGLLVIGATSCKKDKSEKSKEKIEGKWFVTKTSLILYKNDKQATQSEDTDFGDKTAFIQFNSNATGRIEDTGHGYNFNYNVNGSDIQLTNQKFDDNANTGSDQIPSSFTITRVTSTELVLHSEISYKILNDNYRSVQDIYLNK
ncbi:hypothetical protein GCM10023149_09230 [Mucilaginibacter gynuensis]|uniref:Lipocalin-like domain-containing protein n=2 Tax=Mucilaginibacter gynuensis TaxID=1302236 RepID=A0ABP8FY46_9SPHI